MAFDSGIEAALEEIRRRRLLVWLVWVGYLPTVLLIVFGLEALGANPDDSAPFVALPYMALFAAVAIRSGYSRCPRCHEHFHRRSLYGNPWTRKCLHCGLSLHATESDSSL